jgi:hypothetical protein
MVISRRGPSAAAEQGQGSGLHAHVALADRLQIKRKVSSSPPCARCTRCTGSLLVSVTCNWQVHAPRLAGEAERSIMRSKGGGATEVEGAVFLQQRDEAAAVARSALSDIVGGSSRGSEEGGSKQAFRMMQVRVPVVCATIIYI